MPAGFLQYSTVAVGTAALGTFILWHRPGNRYGMTHLAIGLLFGPVVLAAGVLSSAGTPVALPGWAQQASMAWSWIAAAALLPLWVTAIATFPDGSFHRQALKRATVGLAVVMPLLAGAAYLLAPTGAALPLVRVEVPVGLTGPLAPAGGPHFQYRLASLCATVLGTLAPLAAVVALIDRFRKAPPVIRQQIKWLLLGAALSVALQAIPLQVLGSEALGATAQVLVVLAVPLPLVAAAIAIFKFRLWEIDVVISKGLVYTIVSGVLTALFLGIAFVAGVSVGGQDSRVVAALGLSLMVSFLAQPLRQRLEKVVARVLYGDEPRGVMALARLRDAAAAPLSAQELGSRVADVTREALGASWAGVCLYIAHDGSGTLRPVAVSKAQSSRSAVLPQWVTSALTDLSGGAQFADLSAEVAASLRPLFSEQPMLVASLTSSGKFTGLIACGVRPKEPYGNEDLELLALVAHESALGLRNLRLEEELRQRLEQIELQAAELHSSRQRLVTAQDRERKRIQRDLHDGAQQQLVVLAAGLRRAARAGSPDADQALEELANEAEEAVFALQELSRGIYPSMLADRGLRAALQAHAARLPAIVRIEVEPRMHKRRLGPELEAAFYFVALEAVTNAVKHAPSARIIVSLRSDRQKRTVTLEVHDDGPGFDAGSSISTGGLQNMADRIHSLGGVLTVQSVPGGGTWVRAEVEEKAEVEDITSRGATP